MYRVIVNRSFGDAVCTTVDPKLRFGKSRKLEIRFPEKTKLSEEERVLRLDSKPVVRFRFPPCAEFLKTIMT